MRPGWRIMVLLRLVGFLQPFLGWLALSIFLGAATVAAGIGLLGTSAYLIACAALHPSVGALQVAIVGVRFFGISRAVLRYLERLVSHSVNFRHLAGLRVWFYRKLEPLAPAVLQEYRSADLLNRILTDIETLENFYVRAVAPPLSALLVIGGAAWFAGVYDLRISAVLAGALFLGGSGLPVLAFALSRRPGAEAVARRAEVSGDLLDAIQGMADLLAFGQGKAQVDKIRAVGRSLSQAQWRAGAAGSLANALMLVLNGLALLGVLLLAVPQVGERFDGVTLAVLALVTLATFEAITPLIPAGQHYESSLQSARRLFDLAEKTPEVLSPGEPLPAPHSASLHIHDLTFTYPGEKTPAIENLDLDLPPGRHVALLGPSGAGKSSLASLLLRFWNTSPGAVELDGQDIRRYDTEDVRRLMAVIAQPAYLFSSTLRQNLLVARPEASPAEVEHAIQAARLGELVAQLPQGLDTWVGERGLQLSGGERQRVLVARALLRDAPLLICDEPTANLDAETERQLIETLKDAWQGRSVLYITHRLVGLEAMDEILVLENGRVRERGTHSELISKNGMYARWQVINQRAV